MNEAVVYISTVNGTGSLSANRMLSFMFFRCGFNPGAFHFFPSNIAGLPCLFALRLSSKGFSAFKEKADLLISLNPKALSSDLKHLKPSGFLITEEGVAARGAAVRENAAHEAPPSSSAFKGRRLSVSFRLSHLKDCPAVLKKQLKNIVYVGLVSRFFHLNKALCETAIRDFLSRGGKSKLLIDWNLQAFEQGRTSSLKTAPAEAAAKEADRKSMTCSAPALSSTKSASPPPPTTGAEKETAATTLGASAAALPSEEENPIDFRLSPPEPDPDPANPLTASSLKKGGRVFMDGATAAALGALSAGCRLMAWYPITPASSLAESFEKFGARFFSGKKSFSSVQAEDEISAFGMALGAGWAGLRAAAVTSGPGLSLMAEGAGLACFAETPLVLFNIQRAGPSTGLPTRTAQGDLLSSCFLSHGDTKHIVLLPGNAEEGFVFAEKAFNLAEELQTLVIFLSDLDSALNPQAASAAAFSPGPIKRGLVKTEKDLDKGFKRYEESAGPLSAVSYRVLPGTPHPAAGFLTRGSGHNERAEYSEDPEDYKKILDKLKRKWEQAAALIPEPVIIQAPPETEKGAGATAAPLKSTAPLESRKSRRDSRQDGKRKAFVTFGKNESACLEAMAVLKKERGDCFSYMRIRSYPFPKAAKEFLENQDEAYIVEQNRDGQMKSLLLSESPFLQTKLHSVLKYTGEPFSPEDIADQFKEKARSGLTS